MTHVPWFRETLKESKKQLFLAKASFRKNKSWTSWEDQLDWREALFRAKRILQKKKKDYET